MKKFDEIIHDIDVKVDEKIKPFSLFFRKYFVLFSSSMLVLLLIFFIFKSYYDKSYFSSILIKNDLKRVNAILHKIDTECSILSITGGRAQINFLTVKSFAGSVVGGVNLAYPKKWTGAYTEQDPTLQQRYYELVKAKDGYFIIPGSGVRLPNGLVMEKDINITPQTTVADLIKPGGKLFYKGTEFARKITFEIGDRDSATKNKKIETTEKITDFIQELNEAIPYTQNNQQPAPTNNTQL
ncbi:MAG: hypothetical protein ABH827_03290 [bacterium]